MNCDINGKITEYNTPWIIQRADPFVMRHSDGRFYFIASMPKFDKLVLRCSDTLQGLKEAEEKEIWTRHETGEMGWHIWAPELHYLEGKFYIYFAAGTAENHWKIRPYVLECTGQNPMTDTWIERGMMKAADDDEFSFREFSLDATIFEHNGEHYYIWAEKVGVGRMISNLYIAKMESPLKLKTAQVLLTTPDYDWERSEIWVNEGPAVIKKNGRIFVTFSANGTGACYCVGMLSAKEDSDLLDPRSWSKERDPVLKTDEKKGIYGPGHNSFVVDENGNEVMVFHARTYKEIVGSPLLDPNRHTMLLTVKWDHVGYPIFEYQKH